MSVVPSGSYAFPMLQLSEAQIADFRRDGYLLVDKLTTPDEMAFIRSLYDPLFAERRGWEAGDQFDLVRRDDSGKELLLPQLLWPSRYAPALRTTQLYANAGSIARQLLGPKLQHFLEHAINKPAFNGPATPWHQDEAFRRRGSGFLESISIWMPLQDATLESGCMQYIRGSNHGPLYPHRSPGNDPSIHFLETVNPPDLTHCVAVPVPAGGAVIHHSRTLHAAGVNSSNQPRRAYILGYTVKARRHRLFMRDYPWNLEKSTARDARELAALPPLKRLVHRVRRLMRGQKF